MSLKKTTRLCIYLITIFFCQLSLATTVDLGLFSAPSHKNVTIDIDRSILMGNMDYTISCVLAPQEEDTAIQPFSSGSSHISIFIDGFKWPPFTRYEVDPGQETHIAFTHVKRGNKIMIGIQNLDPFDTMTFHCYANDGALK